MATPFVWLVEKGMYSFKCILTKHVSILYDAFITVSRYSVAMTDEYAIQEEVYDIIHADIKDHDREVAQLLKRVRGSIGRDPDSWLDVACGTGLHLAALAKGGVNVLAGIDNSATQIAAAQERLGTLAQVELADMRDFAIDAPENGFDVISCLLSSIGHLESADDYTQQVTFGNRFTISTGNLTVCHMHGFFAKAL